MKAIINDKIHEVIYIEYQNGLPHFMITGTSHNEVMYQTHWDCFPNNGDRNDLCLYESGSGGKITEIQGSQWIDGYIGKYWLSPKGKFKNKVKNGKRLKHPVRITIWGESSINPFKIGNIVDSQEYCMECGHESTEWCQEHQYEDKDGNLRYKKGNELV